MGVHKKIDLADEKAASAARIAMADRAIAKAQKMRRAHVGYASDILVAERRAEFYSELAKDIEIYGT